MGSTSTLGGVIRPDEANGVMYLTAAQIGDLFDIDNRIKNGDESGWRGDPSMCVCINQLTGMFEVWGIDNRGQQYKAATHHKLDHELVRKLVAGDWQKHDVIGETIAANDKLHADQEAADRDARLELAEKMAWAIRHDFAQHLGGRGGVHAIPRKVGG